ncbi:MAG: hypothetical protein IT456_14865 [Planctomycetes bacterium]|jgi:hypothetical protein|nr:hypothetical protein [Planctomycetota bacterium]
MQLMDLVRLFRQGATLDSFCRNHALSPESEAIEIFAQAPVSLHAELGFFPIEETGGRIEFQSNGVRYCSLFDFFYFLAVIEEVNDDAAMDDALVAKMLFSYATKDA